MAFIVSACAAPTPSATPDFYYTIQNAGGPPVTVFVNGVEIGSVECQSALGLSANPRVPSLPWDIEFRRPDGQVAGVDHVASTAQAGVMMIRDYGGFALEFHVPGSSGGPAPPQACVTWPPGD